MVNIDSVIAEKLVSCAGKNPGAASVIFKVIMILGEKIIDWSLLDLIADKLKKTESKPESLWDCYTDLNNSDIDKTIDSFKKWLKESDLSLGEWLKEEMNHKDINKYIGATTDNSFEYNILTIEKIVRKVIREELNRQKLNNEGLECPGCFKLNNEGLECPGCFKLFLKNDDCLIVEPNYDGCISGTYCQACSVKIERNRGVK